MNEVERIANQVDRGYRDGAWVGVSVRGLFRSLTATEAAAHPIPDAHSAWEIALHLSFWHDAVRRRLQGEIVDYRNGEDWPSPGPPSETHWHDVLDTMDGVHHALVDAVRTLNPDHLDETVSGRQFTVYSMTHGVTQHDLYHGGQVMMLKKAVRGESD
jgi:hypothetical protein